MSFMAKQDVVVKQRVLKDQPRRFFVLDTAAFIAGGDSLFALGGLTAEGVAVEGRERGELVEFVTVPEVLSEVRNAQARQRLSLLADSLTQRTPTCEALDAAVTFARATGDYNALSRIDIRVLAVAWMLEKEVNGHKYLRAEPVIPHFSVPKGVPLLDSIKEEEEQQRLSKGEESRNAQQSDGWTTVQRRPPRPRPKPQKGKEKKKHSERNSEIFAEHQAHGSLARVVSSNTHSEMCCNADHEEGSSPTPDADFPVQSNEKNCEVDAREFPEETSECDETKGLVRSAFGLSVADREDSELQNRKEMGEDVVDFTELENEGWINSANLDEHLSTDRSLQRIDSLGKDRVGVVTTDFALQNVLLQMGIVVVSVDGRNAINTVRHYVLRCQSCAEISRELDRKFCGRCGNASLTRVTYKVGKDGAARIYLGKKFQPRLRGTRYPLPLPRGGRNNKDLILCEDQVDWARQRRMEKQRQNLEIDVLDPNTVRNFGARHSRYKPVVVGHGSRNPNEVRSHSRRTKRK